MSFINFLLGRKRSNEVRKSELVSSELSVKQQRLLNFNRVLNEYSDKVYLRWSDAKTEEERGEFIKLSFGLNRFLYELNLAIKSKNYSDSTIQECEDLEKQLQQLL
jgi:hypothetical protein